MAIISALDIADLFPWQILTVYNMGAPRPGNKAFTKACNARVPSIWNIMNEAVCTYANMRFQSYTKACNARVPSIWNIMNEAVGTYTDMRFQPYIKACCARMASI